MMKHAAVCVTMAVVVALAGAASAEPIPVHHGVGASVYDGTTGSSFDGSDQATDLSPTHLPYSVQIDVQSSTVFRADGDAALEFASASQGSATLSCEWFTASSCEVDSDWHYEFTAERNGTFTLDYTTAFQQPTAVPLSHGVAVSGYDGTTGITFEFSDQATDLSPTHLPYSIQIDVQSSTVFRADGDAALEFASASEGSAALSCEWFTTSSCEVDSDWHYDFKALRDGEFTLNYESLASALPDPGTAEYTFQFTGQPDVTFTPGEAGSVTHAFSAGDVIAAKVLLDTGKDSGGGSFDTSSQFDFLIENTSLFPEVGQYKFMWTGAPDFAIAPGSSGTLTREIVAGQTYTAKLVLDTGTDIPGSTFQTDGTFGFDIIEVLPEPPVADPNGPYIIQVGHGVQLDGSGSSDPDGTIVGWSWVVNGATAGSGESLSLSWLGLQGLGVTRNGMYDIELTVTDNDQLTHSASTTLSVIPEPTTLALLGLGGLGLVRRRRRRR